MDTLLADARAAVAAQLGRHSHVMLFREMHLNAERPDEVSAYLEVIPIGKNHLQADPWPDRRATRAV